MMWLCVQVVPQTHIYLPKDRVWIWAQANRELVSRVKCLLGMALLLDWYISILYCYSMLLGTRTENEATILLKLLGWSLIPVASFIMQSTYPVDLSRMERPLKLIWCPIWSLCSATVNFSGWPRFMCHMFLTSDFNGSASLSNIDFATFTRHTVYTHNLCFTDFIIWLFFFTGM
jgi:hypothetical protein